MIGLCGRRSNTCYVAEMNFYSVRISVLCLVDDGLIPSDGYTRDIQVHLIKAKDNEEAFEKALEIGRAEETTYSNEEGRKVRWAFEKIESITLLGKSIEGGEISSRMEGYFPKAPLPFESVFQPESDEPFS